MGIIPQELMVTARIIHEDVSSRMKGRMGDPGVENAAVVGAFAVLGGLGDYVEVGTLWGGSALVVALMKKYFRVPGNVYCVDPLDGYHVHEGLFVPNAQMEAPVTIDTLMENAVTFGVEDMIIPVQKLSYPWPEELEKNVFSVAYIDGDHVSPAPERDWESVSLRTSRFVLFDNCEDKYPDVVRFCGSPKSGWRRVEQIGITCAFERWP